MKKIFAIQIVALVALTGISVVGIPSDGFAQDSGKPIATLRGDVSLDKVEHPPRMSPTEETDRRRARNYPEQPPTIPHKIDGYQLDKNGNQCLSCHARTQVAESGAPMVSVTHFMDREGQTLAAVSPRRYFCNQCHVVQLRVPELVKNTFVDVDSLLAVTKARQ